MRTHKNFTKRLRFSSRERSSQGTNLSYAGRASRSIESSFAATVRLAIHRNQLLRRRLGGARGAVACCHPYSTYQTRKQVIAIVYHMASELLARHEILLLLYLTHNYASRGWGFDEVA